MKNGVFRPGDRLPSQRELATAIGVGIAAIGEAFQRLEMLNVVEVDPVDAAMSVRAVELHRAIYEAVRDHDIAAARDAIPAHSEYSNEIRGRTLESETDVP
jgi:DNA-binding FadR family transcriptional regulator